ncbi:ROK family protein [Candidatus Saccharibacteria bacterium]|nr:ROK family protein [Candidatus Saccharibacteria bacterium]
MYLTIDIGGTKTLIALFSERGRILREKRFLTPEKLPDFLNKLFVQLQEFTDEKPKSVVVAIPGMVESNRPTWFGNRNWKNPPIYEEIRKIWPKTPVYFKNDSDLAALYETGFYPKNHAMFLTFGTGIGGSLAKNGVLTKDSADFEPGHSIVIWDKRPMEWEDVASSKAIRRANHNLDILDIKEKHACDLTAARLAIGLVPLLIEKHPEVVIIGGPLGETFKYYRKTLERLVKIGLNGTSAPVPKLVKAKKPRRSVNYGAYYYAKKFDKTIRGGRS